MITALPKKVAYLALFGLVVLGAAWAVNMTAAKAKAA